jgi:hypothetical protein
MCIQWAGVTVKEAITGSLVGTDNMDALANYSVSNPS